MRCLTVLLLCCLLAQSTSRPQPNQDYKDADVEEYDSEDGAPELSPRRYEDAVADDDKVSSNKDEDEVMQSRPSRNYFCKYHAASKTPEEQRTTKESTNDNERRFSDLKSNKRMEGPEEETAENDQEQSVINGRYDRYNEPNNANKQLAQEMNRQTDNALMRTLQLFRRRDNAKQDESNDVVYDQEQVNNNDKNKRNYDTPELIGHPNLYNHYYNKAPTESKESEDDPYEEIDQEDSNRDRRDTKDYENKDDSTHDSKDKKDLDNFENDAEQAIIQRYLKKLTKKEVEDLMRTLSDDKRAILQQIIDNDGINQAINLNKREITKKAEAVEENNLMDGVQSDSNKMSGSLIEFNGGNGITNDPNGITSTVDDNFSSTKVDESKLNRRSTDASEENASEKQDRSESTTSSTESVTVKSENKREVNVNDLNNERSPDNGLANESQEASFGGLQDEPYVGSQDEDLTQIFDDDAQLHYDYRNPQKRDLMIENSADVGEPMKSLQESFSDCNNYENSEYLGNSDMMPLIRVKRRNNEHAVKKRAAAIFSDSKVAYVPENEDEDSDEGNEIYDDGFFDRTANFAMSNSKGDKVGNAVERHPRLIADSNQSLFKRSSADNADAHDAARNGMSIGSDTDGVLSGVEGVDENLMYTGGCRQKRDAEKITKLEPIDELVKFDMLSNATRSSLVGDVARPSSLVADTDRPEAFGVSFNRDDAFGSPSKGYDGELGRYKRIRRLKQQSEVQLSSSTAKTEEILE